jgi:enediyne biosynthesis protein E4
MSTGARRWRPVVLCTAIVAAWLWGGWKWWEHRRYRKAMAEVEAAIEDGRPGTATRKLTALLAWQPDSDEALYRLGTCEMDQGRTDAADKAWARIRPDSPFASEAILGRTHIRAQRGRFAETEQLIQDALNDPRIDESNLALSLGPVWCLQGRVDETLALIEARWDVLYRAGAGDSQPAINLIRGYNEVRRSPIPVEVVRSSLEQAAQWVPDDDRIWLGRANLAIRVGSYDEAKHWLDACLRRRPEDSPVWRSRLDWTVASHRVAEAMESLEHLPVHALSQAELPRLTAWLAAEQGDRQAERRALERRIEVAPADGVALDRLAELSTQQRQATRAAELRRQKHELEQVEARFQKLYQRNQPKRDAAEMSRLAERLGRWFEARAFAAVAVATDPEREDLRRRLEILERRATSPGDGRRTCAEALSAELDAIGLSLAPAPQRAVR